MGGYAIEEEGTRGRLRLDGSWSIEQAAELRDLLRDAVGRFERVTLDLAGLREADLSIWQLVLSACRAGEDGSGVLLSGLGEASRKLETWGLRAAVEQAGRPGGEHDA
jgi:hypothetical protein